MIPSNAIKQHQSATDGNGGYRIYFVCPQDDKFIFECWDCSLTNEDGSSVGGRKAHSEFSNVEDAITEYNNYLEAWESNAS